MDSEQTNESNNIQSIKKSYESRNKSQIKK